MTFCSKEEDIEAWVKTIDQGLLITKVKLTLTGVYSTLWTTPWGNL
jgi:hypothetical protein